MRGFTPGYDHALQTLQRGPLRQMARVRCRGHGPLLRAALGEAGMVRSSPQKIIAENTDWRFLDELKRELKAGTLVLDRGREGVGALPALRTVRAVLPHTALQSLVSTSGVSRVRMSGMRG